MAAPWLLLTVLLGLLNGPVTGEVQCTYQVTNAFFSNIVNKYCQYGCCAHDCCTRQQYESARFELWTIVGIVGGVVLGVCLIVSVVCYCYRQRRLKAVVVRRGANTNSGYTTMESLPNYI